MPPPTTATVAIVENRIFLSLGLILPRMLLVLLSALACSSAALLGYGGVAYTLASLNLCVDSKERGRRFTLCELSCRRRPVGTLQGGLELEIRDFEFVGSLPNEFNAAIGMEPVSAECIE